MMKREPEKMPPRRLKIDAYDAYAYKVFVSK